MPRHRLAGSAGAWIGVGLASLTLGSHVAWPQSSSRAAGIPRGLTVHFEGPPTNVGYARVVEALGDANVIRFTPVLDDEGSIGGVLKDLDRLPRGVLDPDLDRYLCRQNPQNCRLSGGGDATVARWTNAKAPPDATPPDSPCPRPTLPPFVFCVPEVKVVSYPTTARVHYDASVDVLDRLVKGAGGCRRLDNVCKTQLRAANVGRDVLGRSFRGDINVPITGHALRLEVSSQDVLEKVTTVLDRTIDQLVLDGLVRQGEGAVYYTVASPAVQKYDAFLLPPPPDPIDGGQTPLSVMNYQTPVSPAPILVGIWDTHVDNEHCDLEASGNRSVVLPESLPIEEADPPMPARQNGCATVLPRIRSKKWDHGTFVTGIIAAPANGLGVTGVNPKALVWAYEFRGSRLDVDVDPDPITRIRATGRTPQVINMSFTEDSQRHQTPLESLIKRWESVLFVAAAGQLEGADQGPALITEPTDCRVSPACLTAATGKAPNLISVVPLKADGSDVLPATPEGQPRHGPVFDVAAVGETTGLLHGNAFGPMSGSSVAAPYVTGLASLIFAKEAQRGPSAKQVKERILYTADLSDALDPIVRSGRVNFDRALKTDKEVMELKAVAGSTTQERAVKTQKNVLITVQDAESEGQRLQNPLTIRLGQVRRIRAQDDTVDSAYWVMYVDERGILRKLSNATFASSETLRYTAGNSTVQPVALANVKDYSCSLACQ
jgi:subtilase family protein